MSTTYRNIEMALLAGAKTKAERLDGLVCSHLDAYNFLVAALRGELETTGACDHRFFALCKRIRILRRGHPRLQWLPAMILRMAASASSVPAFHRRVPDGKEARFEPGTAQGPWGPEGPR